MNYIKQLQNKVDSMNTTLKNISEIENELRIYLSSDKFFGFENKFVNPDDVLRFLEPLRNEILNSEMISEIEEVM
jgi:hypothetical protein